MWAQCIHGAQNPVRLHMVFPEKCHPVIMEVDWDDPSGDRQTWTSEFEHLCTAYEAVKMLPSYVTGISIRFKFRDKQADLKEVCKPSSQKLASCVHDNADSEPAAVCIEMRMDGNCSQGIDATFEISRSGPADCCCLRRAWNAARRHGEELEEWESWDDEQSRPQATKPPLVLVMADAWLNAQGKLEVSGTETAALLKATMRLVSGMQALQKVRSDVLEVLEYLNQSSTGQWYRNNVGNSISAVCDAASAATVISCPPVSISLGYSSAVITAVNWGLQMYSDSWETAVLIKVMHDLTWNTLAAQELERARIQAEEALRSNTILFEDGKIGPTDSNTFVTASLNTACLCFDGVSSTCSAISTIPVKVPLVLSWVGAVICCGVCGNGWVTTMPMQVVLQEKIGELQEAHDSTKRWFELSPIAKQDPAG